ncbi:MULTISPECIES: F0F1 ATP synthase subunit alpha [Sphingomonadaceae]|jgi:F-type H+-transporting ATPase subunit alpha|uniref:ATP synthase subunit alpha n=7 Tax=Sphingomonadaceae TaxID=41297 RepID=A0A1E1F7K3_9SPHN|nr:MULTISPECIES: F0F1 ATP synthase subunit alpha [Sphingomonadaceae]KKI19705.1 ATP F0F1 synthase subunit alpha [Sphingomonas sp. Ag1]MBM7407963.1 F-type H+-transporting ATPase subunit alpha [Sphingomonas sp. JUb134]MBZ6382951.1 F0F1 ATP synthase subunit alpha [Sphingomonas sanguinis]NJB98826.1 F-type H+-transporting ATPase subunit alpha [Sphingomonas trueperi]NNG55666.1 F0F1 ATP synthase subunit alpha [Sphingomonas sanguinis]
MPGSPEDWLTQAQSCIARANLGPRVDAIGRVESIGDGVAMVSGLPDSRLDELLYLARGQTGFVHTLDRDRIGCVLLDDAAQVEAGDTVTGSGEVVRVPVGEALLGRVVDPLGRPLDGGAPIRARRFDPVERPAPAIIERDLVVQPVQTGTLAIDAMFAIGRGQRELILGDRATGKTALAVDTIINQRTSDMICVYVAIGQKSSAVARVVDQVRRHGAPDRTIFVVASPAAAPGLQWIAPFAGFTMAEYFRDGGGHAVVVLDDLTKHAATHREIALLIGQPPGREAYPGDVFFLHSRLLERAARLSTEKGGGSLTALPIAETDAGNVSAYIPTNLISITDGQIILDAKLFAQGHKPAIDVGTSVSRVGGKTQLRVLRDASGTMRLDYAQFLELEMFTRFGEQPEPRVRAQIERGKRLRALLVQPLSSPLRVVDQVALAVALGEGLLDGMVVSEIPSLRARLPAWIDDHVPDLCAQIERTGQIDTAQRSALITTVKALIESQPAGSAS